MRKLEIEFERIAAAMESQDGRDWYVDLETGEVFPLADEVLATDTEDNSELIERMETYPNRYEPIPRMPPRDSRRDMADFLSSVQEPALRSRLESALESNHPTRQFNDVLLEFPHERERWFRFHAERMEKRIRAWFEEELQIEAINKPPLP